MPDEQQAKQEKPVQRTKVTLKKPHTHAGVHYDQPLDDKTYGEISVTKGQSDWLKQRGII